MCDIKLLNKGLTFSPNPVIQDQYQVLNDFNTFARSLRLKYTRSKYTKSKQPQATLSSTTTSILYRPMKFLPTTTPDTVVTRYSGFATLENYLDNTKQNIADMLPTICREQHHNLSKQERDSLYKLQRAKQELTIKPADKNLGIVLMDTCDYITQCLKHLTDKSTYRQTEYSREHTQKQLAHVLSNFKPQLTAHSKRLFKYLYDPPPKPRMPRFYGIPKIHKSFKDLPPLRPIVSQSASLLTPTAKFIDHVLQPIANSYPDYLYNSTTLVLAIEDTYVPDEAILVSIDVNSLYPSIPQMECLHFIYNELHSHSHLLTFDPNLIIQLLHININNNYFTFGNTTFKQIKGTAMGAPFSPTMANIFMSVILSKFLRTQSIRPLFIKRYIDDILMIWTGTPNQLDLFLQDLNHFHPNLDFTHQQSASSIDFLDVTIYKGPSFHFSNILDCKTFQKKLNLYQYLHFTSYHPKSVFKALIKGECVRYVKTNSTEESYTAILHSFKKRLSKRNYPTDFVEKNIRIVRYRDRQKYLQTSKKTGPCTKKPPLYKYVPPPQYKLLKQLVLQNYAAIQVMSPRFIPLKHPTLQNRLVRSQIKLTDSQLVDLILTLESRKETTTPGVPLPQLRPLTTNTIKTCNHPRCVTCKVHLNCSPIFKSNYPLNQTVYHIRHSFTCQSTNVIYLVTCTKCRKQYVGCTTLQLKTRINHHRSCINNKRGTYIHKHFNLPDHNITYLKVQPIDTLTHPGTSVQELQNLESFWICTLRTMNPYGLNCK